MNNGSLEILNIGAGHLEFRFDKENEEETAKAKRMIQQMLRSGYAILIETPDGLKRVKRFDPDTACYIVEEPEPKKTKRGGYKMRNTRATGVGATAGG